MKIPEMEILELKSVFSEKKKKSLDGNNKQIDMLD